MNKLAQIPQPSQLKKRLLPEAYPNYGRSLAAQYRGDPETAARLGAGGGGVVGAVIGALASRMLTDDPKKVALAALITGLLGGGVGYHTGRRSQESENTRLYALRRAGINNPAELELISRYPSLIDRLTAPGEEV